MRISSAIWMNFPFWKEGEEEEDGLTDCFIIKRVGRRDLCRVLRNAHTVCCAPLILSEGDLINICTETDGRTDGRRRRMWKCRDADWHSRSVRVVMETFISARWGEKWIGPMIFLSFGGWAPSQITGSLRIAQQNMKDDLRRRRPATTTKGRRGKRSKTDDDHPWI